MNPATDTHNAKLAKSALLVPAIAVPLIWLVGYIVYAWVEHRTAEDLSARYEVTDLLDANAAGPKGSHVDLRGGAVVADLVVAHIKNPGEPSEKVEYRLVPIVPRNWRRDEPVRFVLKAEDAGEFHDLSPPGASTGEHGERQTFLARIGGSIPPTAVMEFRKHGALLTEDVLVLERIPTRDGKPVDNSAETRLVTFYGVCGSMSVVVLLLAIAVWITQRGRPRA